MTNFLVQTHGRIIPDDPSLLYSTIKNVKQTRYSPEPILANLKYEKRVQIDYATPDVPKKIGKAYDELAESIEGKTGRLIAVSEKLRDAIRKDKMVTEKFRERMSNKEKIKIAEEIVADKEKYIYYRAGKPYIHLRNVHKHYPKLSETHARDVKLKAEGLLPEGLKESKTKK